MDEASQASYLQKMKEKFVNLRDLVSQFMDKQPDEVACLSILDLLQSGEFILGCADGGHHAIAFVPFPMPLSACVLFIKDSEAPFSIAEFLDEVSNYCFEEGAVKIRLQLVTGSQPIAGFREVGTLKKEALFKGQLSDIVILERIHPGLEECVEEVVEPKPPLVKAKSSKRRKKQNDV